MLTDAVFDQMIAVADRYTAGVRDVLRSRGLPWTITELGVRAGVPVLPGAATHKRESAAAAAGAELDEYLRLYLVNRGILLTPFHNMALMSPASTAADADQHTAIFADSAAELLAQTSALGDNPGSSSNSQRLGVSQQMPATKASTKRDLR